MLQNKNESEKETKAEQADRSFFSTNAFVRLLGIEVLHCEAGKAKAQLFLRDELLNGLGIGHGGVTMTMLDVVMARAVRSADPLVSQGIPARPGVTAKLETRFLRPAMPGMLYGHAQVTEQTHDEVKTKGWIVDEKGKKIAQATGIFKFLKAARAI